MCDSGTVLAHDQALDLGNSQEVIKGELACRLGQIVKAMINCYRSTSCLLSDRLVSLTMKKGYRKVYCLCKQKGLVAIQCISLHLVLFPDLSLRNTLGPYPLEFLHFS